MILLGLSRAGELGIVVMHGRTESRLQNEIKLEI